jgi:hypothetical protein
MRKEDWLPVISIVGIVILAYIGFKDGFNFEVIKGRLGL